MAQWGDVFTIAGVTVVPHIATDAFDPAKLESLVDDFTIINTELDADVYRARAFLDPFRGKPYGDLLKVLDDMCVVPVNRSQSLLHIDTRSGFNAGNALENYDLPNADWQSFQPLNPKYDEQMDFSRRGQKRWRHRLKSTSDKSAGPWLEGHAPGSKIGKPS